MVSDVSQILNSWTEGRGKISVSELRMMSEILSKIIFKIYKFFFFILIIYKFFLLYKKNFLINFFFIH